MDRLKSKQPSPFGATACTTCTNLRRDLIEAQHDLQDANVQLSSLREQLKLQPICGQVHCLTFSRHSRHFTQCSCTVAPLSSHEKHICHRISNFFTIWLFNQAWVKYIKLFESLATSRRVWKLAGMNIFRVYHTEPVLFYLVCVAYNSVFGINISNYMLGVMVTILGYISFEYKKSFVYVGMYCTLLVRLSLVFFYFPCLCFIWACLLDKSIRKYVVSNTEYLDTFYQLEKVANQLYCTRVGWAELVEYRVTANSSTSLSFNILLKALVVHEVKELFRCYTWKSDSTIL